MVIDFPIVQTTRYLHRTVELRLYFYYFWMRCTRFVVLHSFANCNIFFGMIVRFRHAIHNPLSVPTLLFQPNSYFQLLVQYPNAFEFNDFYLRFLAYHSQSTFFRTFTLDCECERVSMENVAPDTTEGHRGSVFLYIQVCRYFNSSYSCSVV